MGSQDVPLGNLDGLDSDMSKDESLCLTKVIGNGHSKRTGRTESDDTDSADSDNDLEDSPTNTNWDTSRRASSNESFSSRQSANSVMDDEAALECREFMRRYVEKIFSGRQEIDQEEKARFGELCSEENSQGREWFAKYVSAQRCHSKCISEYAFYRLVQSFAVVLFECYQMDDFGPAKNLMTMCFTFYYVGKSYPNVSNLKAKEDDSTVKAANSWLTEKRDLAALLLKNTENVKGFFGGLEKKLKLKNEDTQNQTQEKSSENVRLECLEQRKGEKIYLYTHLKMQPIWHTLRFWNAAFFDAVHCERKKRSPTTREKWCHMTAEERDDSHRFNENIAFGQLGTFTHNMLAFGLSKKLCSDFLKKQSVIGNLNQGQITVIFEDGLGLVDFHISKHLCVLYVSEADLVAGNAYKRKLVRFRNASTLNGIVVVEKSPLSEQYFPAVQRFVVLELGMTVLPVANQTEASHLISQLIHEESREQGRNPFQRRARSCLSDVRILASVQQIPGVGKVKAMSLLQHFHSIQQLSAASTQELEAVVGHALAQQITQFFSSVN
ncbi:uncharacterized protein KIAA0513 homolog isoform X5 [Stegostoma tigrinum]|uniref:uncharacterized protein KIAA0513 homolog isoform X5 n=1 Tax=Stegostoma tigrinum TaxID=3053191 RepID=UPI00202B5DCB|nr:uncharacterized protein KIAA0513 homolog isoform X5 [Stegostoma tigrinum]